MVYSRTSSPRGKGMATAAHIQQWFENGAVAGAAYVGLPVAPIPAGIGDMILRWSKEWGLNSDIVAGLVSHETAFLQSAIFRDKKNPGGHGATNDAPYENATVFESYEEGVRAVVAHLAGYVFGDGPWTRYSARYAIVKAYGWAGSVSELHHLEQKWAFTKEKTYQAAPLEARYGAQLARHANDLLRFVPAVSVAPVSSGKVRKPPMTSRPSPNKDGYSTPRIVEAVCVHIATSTFESNMSWLTSPRSGASCNAYVRKSGEIIEMVPYQSAAWTNGVVKRPDLSNRLIKSWFDLNLNPNTRTYNIEHEGEPSDDLTAAQIKSTIWLIAWVASTAGWEVTRERVLGHYQIDSVDRPYCPSFTGDEWTKLVDGARARMRLGEVLDDPLFVGGSPHPIVAGFKGLYLQQGAAKYPADPVAGGLSLFGLPLGPEGATDYGSVQVFERVIFRYEREASPPWDLVCQHRLRLPA